MGHIAHLRNQFNSMNRSEQSYDYIYHEIDPVDFVNVFLQFCYHLPLEKGVALQFEQT